jgi:leader peptidase (prepilin peptidase)/N-methyltransferase
VAELATTFAPLLDVLLFVFGLIVGSFLNVVIYRLPRDASIVRPRSRCTSCGEVIPAWANIPVFSWVMLRGKCARCRAPISIRYPAVELVTAFLFVAAGRLDGLTLALPFHLTFIASMIAVAFIDLDFQIIPNEITYAGTILGLVFAGLAGRLVDGAIGAAVGAGILWGMGAAYFALRKIEGMGGGDVKLAAMLGAFLGWKGVLLTLFVASFFGALIGLLLIRAAGGDRQTRIPFGTFLAPAAVLVLFAGEPFITWYGGFLTR